MRRPAGEDLFGLEAFDLDQRLPAIGPFKHGMYFSGERFRRQSPKLQRHFDDELAYYDVEYRLKHRKGHWAWVHDRPR